MPGQRNSSTTASPAAPVIVIAGPTASGKSEVAVELALRCGGEVVSADSRQVYRYMDIATAKPSAAERRGVPHHGFDLVEPDVIFSAGRYAAAAREWIERMRAHDRLAIVAGGSGLYLQALTDGLFSGGDIKDDAVRRTLAQRAEREGLEPLHRELRRLDPVYAEKTLPGDRQRILRALEVVHASGVRFSELHRQRRDTPPWPVRRFALELPRVVLYERIDRRVRRMLDRGLLAEVRDLVDRGYEDAYAMKSAGYEEALAFLRGEIEEPEEMVRRIQRNTRRYAKRQLTWFRRDDRITWIRADNRAPNTVAQEIARAGGIE